MTNIIKTIVISPETATRDGFYPWLGADNDCAYHGEIAGYCAGYCVEAANADGSLGYSSVCFVPYGEGTDIALPCTPEGDFTDFWNDLGMTADCCLRSKNRLTGRLVFRGYYSPCGEDEDGDECFSNASDEVLERWNKYVVSFD